MTKAGDEYQEVVGGVARALDPGAVVRVGVWVTGPDGRRDLDVEVRGVLDGRPHFVQIECKDWADPVGIAVVDALDSKRRDLGADEAIVYSNSGFTQPALHKASRLQIGMASALKMGDQRIKIQVHKQLIAKRVAVDFYKVALFPPTLAVEDWVGPPPGWQLGALSYEGLPVQNWIASLSRKVLTEHEFVGDVNFTCVFDRSEKWSYAGAPIDVGALRVTFTCSRQWLWQDVRQDVTLGLYDHIRKVVTIPANEGYMMGWIDRDAWNPLDYEPEPEELKPGSFRLDLSMLKTVPAISPPGVPDLDGIVVEQAFTTANPLAD